MHFALPPQRRVVAQEGIQLLVTQRTENFLRVMQRSPRELFHRLVRRVFFQPVMEQWQQTQNGDLPAARTARHRFRAREKHDMQHHIIVGVIRRMPVSRPILRMQMQLDIAGKLTPIQHQSRPRKIRPTQMIPLTGMHDFQRTPIGDPRGSRIEFAALPDFLQQALGK